MLAAGRPASRRSCPPRRLQRRRHNVAPATPPPSPPAATPATAVISAGGQQTAAAGTAVPVAGASALGLFGRYARWPYWAGRARQDPEPGPHYFVLLAAMAVTHQPHLRAALYRALVWEQTAREVAVRFHVAGPGVGVPAPSPP